MHEILQRAQTEGTPLIDSAPFHGAPPYSDTATFVWRGKHPPVLIGDFTNWENGPPQTFTRLSRGVWTCTLALPRDAYLEYVFLLDGERQPDPFNPRTTPNGLGKTNHYFYMPAGSPTDLTRKNPSIPHGMVTRHVLSTASMDMVIGRQRTVYLYQPPVEEPAPLLVVWDGSDYLRRVRLPTILDNLLAEKRVRPLALALVQNGGPARTVEYTCSDTTLGFLTQAILPLAQANLHLTDPQQGNYGVLGASMGGLMALYTGIRLPKLFNRVLSQSGAFIREDYDPVVYDLIRYTPVQPIKIWLEVGIYDFPEIYTANQSMAALLQERGYTFTLQQYPAGHNYPAWRDNLGRGLEELFG
jgi:enterochelin esterase-like enzyme